jgi:hypothetical protein
MEVWEMDGGGGNCDICSVPLCTYVLCSGFSQCLLLLRTMLETSISRGLLCSILVSVYVEQGQGSAVVEQIRFSGAGFHWQRDWWRFDDAAGRHARRSSCALPSACSCWSSRESMMLYSIETYTSSTRSFLDLVGLWRLVDELWRSCIIQHEIGYA